ncbi:MAG: hypothetical protein Q7J01_07330 [Syntrophales bacterium]|nr:hypothetical protein [Syntrophales bacterium]
MRVYNVHERQFPVSVAAAGALIDTLSGPDDALWPRDRWPAMKFDTPLRRGARGGHGGVRYSVYDYAPGKRIVFRFDGTGLTRGLTGRHLFEVMPRKSGVVLRHIVDAEGDLKDWLQWQCLVGPLHDALLKDALDHAEYALLGSIARPARWSVWVRFLRRMLQPKRVEQ